MGTERTKAAHLTKFRLWLQKDVCRPPNIRALILGTASADSLRCCWLRALDLDLLGSELSSVSDPLPLISAKRVSGPGNHRDLTPRRALAGSLRLRAAAPLIAELQDAREVAVQYGIQAALGVSARHQRSWWPEHRRWRCEAGFRSASDLDADDKSFAAEIAIQREVWITRLSERHQQQSRLQSRAGQN